MRALPCVCATDFAADGTGLASNGRAMTVRIIGHGCRNGTSCNPGHPARPVWSDDGLCWPCHALGRVVEGIQATVLECVMCGGDPVGGEVQPVFGLRNDVPASGHASLPEPLMFCHACAAGIRERRAIRENAAQPTEAIDSLEVAWRAQFGSEAA